MIETRDQAADSTVQTTSAAPRAAFAPVLAAASVTEATRGRQSFNDSDKDNYFEG